MLNVFPASLRPPPALPVPKQVHIPVVRRTGGLNDSVFDVEHDQERAADCGKQVNGFNFEGTDTGGLDYALNRSAHVFTQTAADSNVLQLGVVEQCGRAGRRVRTRSTLPP